jgi:hypothetical protein
MASPTDIFPKIREGKYPAVPQIRRGMNNPDSLELHDDLLVYSKNPASIRKAGTPTIPR